jgi:hypothetical protein
VVKVLLGPTVGVAAPAGAKAIEAKSIKKITTLRKEPAQKLLIKSTVPMRPRTPGFQTIRRLMPLITHEI